jgi:hypothetical protein
VSSRSAHDASIFPVSVKPGKRRTEPDLDLIKQVEQVTTLVLERPARRFARFGARGLRSGPRISNLSIIRLTDISLQKTARTASVLSSKCSYNTARGARSSNYHSAKHPEALPLDGGGLGRGDVRQIAAHAPRVSEIWSIREQTACWDRMSFFAAPLQRHRHPHPNPPPRGGGLLRARYFTAIERHCTRSGRGRPVATGQSGIPPAPPGGSTNWTTWAAEPLLCQIR